jgi:hypothetical protein
MLSRPLSIVCVAQEDVALRDLSRLVFSRYKTTRGRALGPLSVMGNEYRVLSRGHSDWGKKLTAHHLYVVEGYEWVELYLYCPCMS